MVYQVLKEILQEDNYSITSQDLVDGLLRSSGAARNMNMSLDETISLLTIMREASGRTGQEVGNALNSIISYIQRPGSIKTLESMGIGMFADEAGTKFRNVMEIFKDIASNWGSASKEIQDGFIASADDAGLFNEELATALGLQEEWNDLQQRDVAQASAGVYRRNYFIGMINRMSNAQEVLNGLTDANGYSMRENERTMDTLEKKYQSLKTSAEQLAVALGDAGLLDLLKDIVDTGTDVTSAIASIDDEAKVLLTTALELVAVIGSIKAISGLFTDKNILFGATAMLPGWTKLLAIIPGVIGAIALYKNNLDSAVTSVDDFNKRQEDITKNYDSQIKAAEESAVSMEAEAKTAETLAEKLELLNQKESLNISEKAQMKAIVDQLNTSFPNLSLAIDNQTGKVIGNTTAIYDNIEALKKQAVQMALQSQMQATATSYVNQEMLVGDTQNALDIARKKHYDLQRAYNQAQSEYDKVYADAKNNDFTNQYAAKQALETFRKYDVDGKGIKQQVDEAKKLVDELTDSVAKGNLELFDFEKEMNRLGEKSIELGVKFQTDENYIPSSAPTPTSTSTSTGASGSYKNAALENALKVLDYKRYINELTLEDELKTLYEIKANHVNTADELMDINKRIYTAEQKLLDEKKNSYRLEESNIQHMAKLGVYSVEQQIEAYKELYSIKAESLADEQNRVENLFNLYKQLLSEEQKKVKEAYDERIDLIDEEAKRKKENLEDEKKSIQEQMDLLDRKDNERSYEQTMQGLQDELKYWQVRTSEEARKKVIEIQNQLEEEKYKHELEKQKESLQDKIDVLDDEIDEVERTADEEKKKWEKSYKQIEKAFDTHSTNIVALAGAMSKEAYQEWVNNYLTPLSSALSSGNFDMFDNLSGGLDSSIGGLNPGYGQNYVLVNADGTSNAKAGDIVVTGGGLYKKNADGTSTKVGDLSGGSTSDYNKVIEEYNNLIPKFHNGGKLLTDGLLIGKKQEMVLTPDLSLKMEGLLNFLKGNTTFNKNSSSTAYDNRKEVKIGNLVNIENNHMEDEVDSNIFARELSRQLANL